MHVGTGGRPDQEALFPREPPRHAFGRDVAHLDHPIQEPAFEDLRDETRAKALNAVHPSRLSGQHRAPRWLDGDDQHVLAELLAQHAPDTRDRSTRTHAAHERSQVPRGLLQDLDRRGALMGQWIRGIGELARHERAGRLFHHLLGTCDRAGHPIRGRREHDVRAVRTQDVPTLEAHVLRHHEHAAVAADRSDHREADAGVAAGGFDDGRARAQTTRALGLDDHGQRRAILHAACRVHELALAPDGRSASGANAPKSHEGRIGNEGQRVVGDTKTILGNAARLSAAHSGRLAHARRRLHRFFPPRAPGPQVTPGRGVPLRAPRSPPAGRPARSGAPSAGPAPRGRRERRSGSSSSPRRSARRSARAR